MGDWQIQQQLFVGGNHYIELAINVAVYCAGGDIGACLCAIIPGSGNQLAALLPLSLFSIFFSFSQHSPYGLLPLHTTKASVVVWVCSKVISS